MNPFINQSTNMYGISPITQALAQAMGIGLQSYQQARQAKATELANILARRQKLEDIASKRAYETAEKIRGEKARENLIRLEAGLKPAKPEKPAKPAKPVESEETPPQRQKRAESYFKEAYKILSKYIGKDLPPGEATIIKEWIRKYNEISDRPIILKEPPLPKLTYKLLEMEYPEYSATIVNGRKNKLSPEETLNKIATEIIKKERAKELTWKQRKFTDWGYEPSPEELSEATKNILADILVGKKEAPTLEFGTPEELSQPVQNWKSVIP